MKILAPGSGRRTPDLSSSKAPIHAPVWSLKPRVWSQVFDSTHSVADFVGDGATFAFRWNVFPGSHRFLSETSRSNFVAP
jgi:hypothetical protein